MTSGLDKGITFTFTVSEDKSGRSARDLLTGHMYMEHDMRDDDDTSSTDGYSTICDTSASYGNGSWGYAHACINTTDLILNLDGNSTVNAVSFLWADIALVTLFCCIIAGTVAGNALVIAAVVTTRRLRTVTNCFVMSLAVADWLVGMFVMPPKVALYLVNNEWRLGGILCELWISLDILLCTASILSLCAISIDRYLAITRPLAYSRRRRSKRLALSMISCVWVAAVVITSPPIFGWYDSNRNVENKCEYNENTGYVLYSALGSFFLPLSVMLYVYARIACVIAQRQKTIQNLHNSDKKYYGGESEEPLHREIRGNDRVSGSNRLSTCTTPMGVISSGEVPSMAPGNPVLPVTVPISPGNVVAVAETSPSSSCINARHLSPNTGNHPISQFGGQQSQKDVSFWKRLTCNSFIRGGSSKKGKSQRSGRSTDIEANSTAMTIAINVPNPGTLLRASESREDTGDLRVCTSSQATVGHSCHHKLNHQQHHVCRTRTGSRLCHHSVVTTSPQRNIHRAHSFHQETSVGGGVFSEDEDEVRMCGSNSVNLRKETSRGVWTVEEAPLVSSNRVKSMSSNGRLIVSGSEKESKDGKKGSQSLHKKNGSSGPSLPTFGNVGGAMPSHSIEARVAGPSDHSAVNPATCESKVRGQSRVYQQHSTQSTTPHSLTTLNHSSGGGILQPHGLHSNVHVQRRSMRLTLNLHGSGTGSEAVHGESGRDFTSGRVASFKRETKTAQTLAAVVGGFIICWLPFFVAYVIGPFIPPSEPIPTALMDALIWLGWSNSAINPFIYAFYSADFRSAFWRLTVHKCEGLLRPRSPDRSSPRRYDDTNTALRMSA